MKRGLLAAALVAPKHHAHDEAQDQVQGSAAWAERRVEAQAGRATTVQGIDQSAIGPADQLDTNITAKNVTGMSAARPRSYVPRLGRRTAVRTPYTERFGAFLIKEDHIAACGGIAPPPGNRWRWQWKDWKSCAKP